MGGYDNQRFALGLPTKAVQVTFSADSKLLYGIRVDGHHNTLFSIDLATKEVKNIGDVGKDFTPASYSNPGIRLSLSAAARASCSRQ